MMRRPSAATDRAAPPVEELKLDAALASDFVQRSVGLENLPGAREHPAVLVRVRVAEHHLLPPAPGVQVRRVLLRTPKRAAHARAVAKVFDGLEERDGHQSGVSSRLVGRDAHAATLREPDESQHVRSPARAAYDVAAYRLRRKLALQLRDRAQAFQRRRALLRERLGQFGRPFALNSDAFISNQSAARQLFNRARVDARVL